MIHSIIVVTVELVLYGETSITSWDVALGFRNGYSVAWMIGSTMVYCFLSHFLCSFASFDDSTSTGGQPTATLLQHTNHHYPHHQHQGQQSNSNNHRINRSGKMMMSPLAAWFVCCMHISKFLASALAALQPSTSGGALWESFTCITLMLMASSAPFVLITDKLKPNG